MVIMLLKISEIGSAKELGRKVSIAPVIACISIAVIVPAPWDDSIPRIGPLTIITGRKNIRRKIPFPLIFWFSIIAIINANTTIIGTDIIVDVT